MLDAVRAVSWVPWVVPIALEIDGTAMEEAMMNYGGQDLLLRSPTSVEAEGSLSTRDRADTVITHLRHFPNVATNQLHEKGCKQHPFSYIQQNGSLVEVMNY